VLIDGEDAASFDVVALRRRIGYVIQHIGLFPHQTITENVATVPRLLGWPKQRIADRVDELLVLVGLEPHAFAHRYPAQLSGGERQRVGVARALAAEPPLLLMDEPFGAVDPIVRERLQDEFLRLQRTLGTTVLFVTHDIDEAIKLGDRVAVMQVGGRLAQYSPPADLLMNPASDYVARFVGGDRILKRLALMRVADVALEPVVEPPTDATCSSNVSVREALSRLLVTPGGRLLIVDDATGAAVGSLTVDVVGSALRSSGQLDHSVPDPMPTHRADGIQ
jgi:osmoprotectant transport system ATP-binding protein